MMYQTQGFYKTAEQDEWKEGCLPNTQRNFPDDSHTIMGETIPLLLRNIARFVDAETSAFLLNSCGEAGRIDVQVTEDDDSTQPSTQQIEAWKKGKTRLWLATYTFHVQKVEPVTLPKIDGYEWEEPDN